MSNADKENVCCKCEAKYEEEYYKYENEIYCFDCLTETLEKEGELYIVETKHYYNVVWRELGTDEEMSAVIQNICDNYDIEVVV